MTRDKILETIEHYRIHGRYFIGKKEIRVKDDESYYVARKMFENTGIEIILGMK